jgi:hypothetical protein
MGGRSSRVQLYGLYSRMTLWLSISGKCTGFFILTNRRTYHMTLRAEQDATHASTATHLLMVDVVWMDLEATSAQARNSRPSSRH